MELKCLPWKTWLVIFLGQTLSLLITGTNVTSEFLARDHAVFIPTSQSFFNYVLLMLYLFPLFFKGEAKEAFSQRWWVYLIVALIDVEANFLVVKAFQYTTITSIMLIDCFTIPTVMCLSYFFLKVRFTKLHFLGVVMCLVGLSCLVVSDIITGKTEGQEGQNLILGDILCFCGAILYGISNVTQEYLVKARSTYEYLGLLGLFGTLIGGIQVSIVEREALAAIDWNGSIIGLIFGFSIFLFLMYSLVPIFLQKASATLLNLSLLTSDFYGLLFGIFLFEFTVTPLYFFAFVVIIAGVAIYQWRPPKEIEAPPPQDEEVNQSEDNLEQLNSTEDEEPALRNPGEENEGERLLG